jgi:hypothetical protein
MPLTKTIECEATVSQPTAAAQFEFALALSDLSPLGVVARAVVGWPAFEDEGFVFTGWICPDVGEFSRLRLSSKRLALTEGSLYLIARRRDHAPATGEVCFDEVTIRPASE